MFVARIGVGRTAEVFLDAQGFAVKLFYAECPEAIVEQELRNAALVDALDLPAPKCLGRMERDGRMGILYECIRGESLLAHLMQTGDAEAAAECMAQLHQQVLACKCPEATDIRMWLKRQYESMPETQALQEALNKLEEMPEGDTLLHGDFHPDNIQLCDGKAYILDWMNLCRGDRMYDIARTYCLLAKAKLPPEMEEAQAGAVQKMREELAKRYLEKMGAEYAQIEDWVRIICAVLV